MAIRQYIGARYVPKFLGTYSATTTYEALSVVDDGYGTSYITKKTTPAGTALTDTEYWTLYGATSGAIIDLQNRVGTLENDVSAINTTLTSLVPSASKHDLIILTDSYGNITDNFTTYLSDLGIYDLFNNVYIRATSSNGCFATGVWPADILDITVNDPDEIYTILVVGGTNDAKQNASTYAATVTTGIGTFITNIKSRFTNVKDVFYLYTPHVNVPNYTGVNLNAMYKAAADAFYDDELHMSFINGIALYDPWTETAADLMHPTASGSKKIAGAVLNVLKHEPLPDYEFVHGDSLANGTVTTILTKNTLTISVSSSGSFTETNLSFVLSGATISMLARNNADGTCKIVNISSNSGKISTLPGAFELTNGQVYYLGSIPNLYLGYQTAT